MRLEGGWPSGRICFDAFLTAFFATDFHGSKRIVYFFNSQVSYCGA